MRSLAGAAIAAALLLVSADARAQRGADFIAQDEIDQGPRANFPGIFDTTTLARGQSLFSLPAMGIDYGVTDNLSVGSNGILLLSNLGLQPTFFARARYRFHSSERWRSVIDAAAGVARTNTEDVTVFGDFVMFGSNVTYRRSALHSFTGSALAFRLGVDVDEGAETSEVNTSFAGLILAFTHELAPSDWFSLRTSLVFAPAIRGAIDEIGSTVTIEAGGTQALLQRNGLRLLASVRLGRQWLLTGGGMLVAFSPYGLPWLSVAKLF